MSPQAADTDAGAHRGPVILFTTQAPVQAHDLVSVETRRGQRDSATRPSPHSWALARYKVLSKLRFVHLRLHPWQLTAVCADKEICAHGDAAARCSLRK